MGREDSYQYRNRGVGRVGRTGGNVLPEGLMISMNRRRAVEDLHVSSDTTLRELNAGLEVAECGSSRGRIDIDWDKVRESSVKEIISKMDFLIKRLKSDSKAGVSNDKTLPMKISDRFKLKDLHVNINVNLNIVNESKKEHPSRTPSKNKYSVVKTMEQSSIKNGLVSSTKNSTTDKIKLLNFIKNKFSKKQKQGENFSHYKSKDHQKHSIQSSQRILNLQSCIFKSTDLNDIRTTRKRINTCSMISNLDQKVFIHIYL